MKFKFRINTPMYHFVKSDSLRGLKIFQYEGFDGYIIIQLDDVDCLFLANLLYDLLYPLSNQEELVMLLISPEPHLRMLGELKSKDGNFSSLLRKEISSSFTEYKTNAVKRMGR